jgi:hypothetical protein
MYYAVINLPGRAESEWLVPRPWNEPGIFHTQSRSSVHSIMTSGKDSKRKDFSLSRLYTIILTFPLLWLETGGRAVSVTCWWGSSYVKLAFDIFIQSSKVLINVSQVAPSRLVASSSFCKWIKIIYQSPLLQRHAAKSQVNKATPTQNTTKFSN